MANQSQSYSQSDLHNLHKCECEIPRAKSTTIDLTDTEPKKETGTPVGSPSGQTMIDLTNFGGSQSTEQTAMPADTPAAWIKNSLYVLNEKDRQLITSPTGWLDDRIIQASQLLLAQHFPDIEGLQPPTLEQIQGFRVHFFNCLMSAVVTGYLFPMWGVTRVLCMSTTQCILLFPCLQCTLLHI